MITHLDRGGDSGARGGGGRKQLCEGEARERVVDERS